MISKKSVIISLLPLSPVRSGMQNTTYLLYKFLKKKQQKVIFIEIKTSNKIDPIINLRFNKFEEKKINKIVNFHKPDNIFVNTTKILNTYRDILLANKRTFKTILISHDLYYFRKEFLKQAKVKDQTFLEKQHEINLIKKTNFIIDFSKKEHNYLIKNGIKINQLINTMTPTGEFKKDYNHNAKFDALYLASDWLQNKINIIWLKKKIHFRSKNLRLLLLGNIHKFKNKLNKELTIKTYQKKNISLAKLGLALFNSGTGRKVKIFEMLAAGLPVITNLDLSEFGLKKNKHYIGIDNNKLINQAISKLLINVNLRKKLSKNAYNWSKKNSFYIFAFKKINKILR